MSRATGTHAAVRPLPLPAVRHSLTMAWRGLLRIKHDPQRMFDVVVLPAVSTVMFANVFGGALAGGVRAYLPHLVPGIMVQIAVTASVVTGVQLRGDMDTGLFDRFRSMPIARVAPLIGALVADMVRYVTAEVMTIIVGLVMGYRPPSEAGLLEAGALVVACAFGLSWIFALLGVVMRSASAVQGASMLLLTPLSFMSNVLVPVKTMPKWMQAVADVNPITHMVDAVTDLAGARPAASEVVLSLGMAALLTLVIAPVAVVTYVRRAW